MYVQVLMTMMFTVQQESVRRTHHVLSGVNEACHEVELRNDTLA
jgi:hypothetical protein